MADTPDKTTAPAGSDALAWTMDGFTFVLHRRSQPQTALARVMLSPDGGAWVIEGDADGQAYADSRQARIEAEKRVK